MELITSANNPTLKLLRSLSQRKYREETGLFSAEGAEYARKAQRQGFRPYLLVVDRDDEPPGIAAHVAWCAQQGGRTVAVPHDLMKRLSGLTNPQQLILVCYARWLPWRDPAREAALALHEVRDPGNLGTIMRTAEAAAVTRLLLIGDGCDPYSPETVRASAGSVFAMEMSAFSKEEFLGVARNWPADVVGTHVKAHDSYRGTYRQPVLLLMGSESQGLPEDLVHACTRLVRIPMESGVESLNVAIATALMLYEVHPPRAV
jgi:RNA methyltransferase, TrmH family